jgi:hypothetical protein
LRVPAFQRGFVWDANMVAFLMDSIYKRYPIGSLLVWRTRERLLHERKLGPFTLPRPEEEYPVDYILDGQQRVTSVFGVFQTELMPETDPTWSNIYFDLEADPDVQESQFLVFEREGEVLARHFPLNTLFNTTAYRRATARLTDELAERIDRIQTVFKEARIPVQMITTDDRTTVAIVFERVNQRGVPLDTLQLLTAWTWSEEFDLHRQFEDLGEVLEPFGFSEVGEDNNLLLRCCSAVLAHDASTKTLISLNGGEVRRRFDEVKNGLKGAIDFLRENANVFSLDNLPYARMLIPLAVFFATPANNHVHYSDEQRRQLLRWFWRASYSKRYNSQPIRNLQTDIEEMLKLKHGDASALGDFDFPPMAPAFFATEKFRMNGVTTKAFILMLAAERPRSFITGAPVALGQVLRDYNKKEFHHLFPKSYLRVSGQGEDLDMSCLANFCFLSRSDNSKLGGVAPSAYRGEMGEEINEILDSAICPLSLFDDRYDHFIAERAELLASRANHLCGVEC